MGEKDITDLVRDALKSAKENGYLGDIAKLAPGSIAIDLMDYCSELEDHNFCEVANAVHICRLKGWI